MLEKNTITRHDQFRIEQDGTFQIKLGAVTLIFEITEDSLEGAKFAHLKSPEKVHFRVKTPTHFHSPTVDLEGEGSVWDKLHEASNAARGVVSHEVAMEYDDKGEVKA